MTKLKALLLTTRAMLVGAMALIVGIIAGAIAHDAVIEHLAIEIIALDTHPKTTRSDAIKIARACMATKGAVATMHKNRDGNLSRVECDLRIKEEE